MYITSIMNKQEIILKLPTQINKFKEFKANSN
jgi:hypothetical protein